MTPDEAQRIANEAVAAYDSERRREQLYEPAPFRLENPNLDPDKNVMQFQDKLVQPLTLMLDIKTGTIMADAKAAEALNTWFTETLTRHWQGWYAKSFEMQWDKRIAKFTKMLGEEVGLALKQLRAEIETKTAQLRSITVRGTFDCHATYQQHNVVALNGGSFIALKDNPGECPGSGWQLLASAGARGKPADSAEVVTLRRQLAELRNEVKALRAAQNGKGASQ
jgi:hypothetical protein